MSAVVPPTPLDRLLNAFRRLVRLQVSQLRFLGTYEYTVTATDGTYVDAAPVDTTQGLPFVGHVPLRSDSIATQTPAVGATCELYFVNGDPSRPSIRWTTPTPTSVAIAGGGPAVARVGDSVSIGMLQAGPYPVTTGGAGAPLSATISGGSSKVSCG
jgi:hypothetical protein